MQMTSRQPSFTMPWQERQSRLTTFFRGLLAIPPLVWAFVIWSIALIVTVPVAWFALLFTGRYPQALFDFNASWARYVAKADAYGYLATDRWPGFSGADDDYPVRLSVGPPLPVYSRPKVALRIFLLIPVALIAYAMRIVASIAALIAWFAIVITGKMPEGIHQMLRLGLSYMVRALPYFLLLTEDWPTFTVDDDERPALEPVPPVPQAPPPPAGGAAPQAVPRQSDAPPNLGDFRPPTPPDDAA